MHGKRQTRLSQCLIVRCHPHQHPPHRRVPFIPQQPVKPPFVVPGTDDGGILGKKALFVHRVEIAVDPGRAQCRRATGDITRIQQNLSGANPARGADRWIAPQPGASDRIGLTGQGLLGMLTQRLLMGPVRVLLNEIRDIGEAPRSAGTGIIDPPQNFEWQLVLDRRAIGVGPVPIPALGGRQRGSGHLNVSA